MPFAPAIVAPTYNNSATLPAVMRDVLALGLPVMVVNDGSTDATATWLAAWAQEHPDQVTVITHAHNRGKAAALMSGFTAAARAGCTHAATIDTDGQLDASDLPPLLTMAAAHPEALIVGARDDTHPDYPAPSRTGRRLSNLAIRLETGVRVADCQCGLRVYPLRLFNCVRCWTGRFAFEAEIITRAAWAGCAILSVPVSCQYFQGAQRVSHFRPWKDSLHGILLHTLLLARRLVPLPHRRMTDATGPRLMPWRASFWKAAAAWLSPMRMWRELRSEPEARMGQSLGVALGVLIANLPIYGLQTLACLYLARRLHLHPLPVVLGSQLSTPPINIVLAVSAIAVGHSVLHGSWPTLASYDFANEPLTSLAAALALQWVVGSVIVGGLLGVVFFMATYYALGWLVSPRPGEASDTSDTKPIN